MIFTTWLVIHARPRSAVGGHLTRKSEVLGSIPVWPHTFVSPYADSRGTVVSYWRKYVREVLVNRLGGLSLPRKSVVRLIDRLDMTLDVDRGRKTTTQQQQQSLYTLSMLFLVSGLIHTDVIGEVDISTMAHQHLTRTGLLIFCSVV